MSANALRKRDEFISLKEDELCQEWSPAMSPKLNHPGPYHSLQEAVDRIEVHCRSLTAQGVPAETTDSLRGLATYFTGHFVSLELLRSRLAQLAELWERP